MLAAAEWMRYLYSLRHRLVISDFWSEGSDSVPGVGRSDSTERIFGKEITVSQTTFLPLDEYRSRASS